MGKGDDDIAKNGGGIGEGEDIGDGILATVLVIEGADFFVRYYGNTDLAGMIIVLVFEGGGDSQFYYLLIFCGECKPNGN